MVYNQKPSFSVVAAATSFIVIWSCSSFLVFYEHAQWASEARNHYRKHAWKKIRIVVLHWKSESCEIRLLGGLREAITPPCFVPCMYLYNYYYSNSCRLAIKLMTKMLIYNHVYAVRSHASFPVWCEFSVQLIMPRTLVMMVGHYSNWMKPACM